MKAMFNRYYKSIRGFIGTMQYCLALSWRASAFYTIVRIIVEVVQPLCSIIATLIAKQIIDLLAGAWEPINGNKEMVLLWLMLATLAVTLFRVVLQRAQQYCESLHSDLVNKQISLDMMDKSLNAGLSLFDNTEYYNRLTAAQRDSSSLSYILWNAISVLSASITVIATFAVIAQQNILYGVLMVCAALPSTIASFKYTKTIYRLNLSQIQNERQKQYYTYVASEKRYAQEIRLYGLGDWLKNKYADTWSRLFNERKPVIRQKSILVCILEFLPEIVVTMIALDIGRLIFLQQATVGDYSLYTGLLSQLWGGLYVAINAVMHIYDNMLKVNNVKSIDEIILPPRDTGLAIKHIESIEFKNVCFKYPGCESHALKDISFSVYDGDHIALVGTNGSGKSTLIKLTLGLYPPSSGEILINGNPIELYSSSSLFNCFSVYFQDSSNYAFSIRDNVAIADVMHEPDDQRIIAALYASGTYDSQKNYDLNQYYSRLFSDDGLELSGGEQQKLALSRLFYRPGSALILDEPSSSLDPEAEHILFEHIAQLCKGTMAIFTSHRLTNVTLADKIIVMEEGRIIEQGTLNDLVYAGGRFAQLYDYQASKYVK